jgi:hypothetical protein
MIEQVREYFRVKYSHVALDELTDVFIRKYLENGWVLNVPFERKMDLLYDYILSNDLTYISR